MKKSILQYLTKRLLKKQEKDVSIGYKHAQNVAVLINTEDKWPELKSFLNELRQDEKELKCLYFYGKNDPAEAGHEAYHPGDISLFGNMKTESLHKFTRPTYDYCFILDSKPHTYIEYIAANIKSQTTIGFVYPEGNYLADLQVKPDHGKELDDLLRYARQLS